MVILNLFSCLVKSERKFVYATGKSIAVASTVKVGHKGYCALALCRKGSGSKFKVVRSRVKI